MIHENTIVHPGREVRGSLTLGFISALEGLDTRYHLLNLSGRMVLGGLFTKTECPFLFSSSSTACKIVA